MAAAQAAGTKFLTPDNEPGTIARLFVFPVWFEKYLTGFFLDASNPDNWENFGSVSPDVAALAGMDLIAGGSNLIGTILQTTGAIPDYGLLCDGSFYLRLEYPHLWEVLPHSMKNENGFTLPDLRERFLLGGDVAGQTGGEKEHTLTEMEMPPHDHGGHTHFPAQATGEIPTPVPDMPIPDPLGTRGGGLPHNNMPPYYTVRFFMVAK